MIFRHPDNELSGKDHPTDKDVKNENFEEIVEEKVNERNMDAEKLDRDEETEDREEEEKESSRQITDEVNEMKISRGPDELDRIMKFEKKSRNSGLRNIKTLREQIMKSKETTTIIYDKNNENEDNKKFRTVLSAIGFLILLLGLLYILHRQRASVAAIGKRS